MALQLDPKQSEQEESHWLSVSDLMTGLMMVFLLIAIAYMQQTLREKQSYKKTKENIYQSLKKTFENDKDIKIDEESLTITLPSQKFHFAQGVSKLSEQHKELLDDFFPKYLKAIEKFLESKSINEIQIEGHTSSEGQKSSSEKDAYFYNMMLSQARTRSVLEHIYSISQNMEKEETVRQYIAAVGRSSSRLKYDKNGKEDKDESRRVTFRIITNAEGMLGGNQ